MPRIEVRSFHCTLESTWGLIPRARARRRRRESDEAVFVLALLGIDTGGSGEWTDWVYRPEDRFREIRTRHSTDVDSGEDHVWEHPMAFDNFGSVDNTIFELLLQVYEVDGSTETSSQAVNINNRFEAKLNDQLRPGLALGSSPDRLGNSGPTSYDAAFEYAGDGGNDDLLFADVWHIDPMRPLEFFDVPTVGGLDPDLQINHHLLERSITREVSRFPPRPDGKIIERREYSNSRERASYRFDVHYFE